MQFLICSVEKCHGAFLSAHLAVAGGSRYVGASERPGRAGNDSMSRLFASEETKNSSFRLIWCEYIQVCILYPGIFFLNFSDPISESLLFFFPGVQREEDRKLRSYLEGFRQSTFQLEREERRRRGGEKADEERESCLLLAAVPAAACVVFRLFGFFFLYFSSTLRFPFFF